ncbi:MAG: FGGY family carbohydrate kinase, partial [Clostridia bacterium]|nr:FGGY family carbohydrate kinase [Clostridia bacterium]
MRAVLLGIDIGTSACKAALYAEDGSLIAQENAGYPVYYPEPGWAEQEPDAWWNAACEAIRGAMERGRVTASEIAGVGIAGQSWSAVPIDTEGRALARTPIWTDTRAKS